MISELWSIFRHQSEIIALGATGRTFGQ